VALDAGSRTSAALVRILLKERHGLAPHLASLSMDADPERADADAVLLIGDRAMRACLPGFAHAYDLGQEWDEWTSLPFVYAFWAVRDGVDLGPVAQALADAKKRGLAETGLIAHEEAPRLGLDAGFCRRYLSTILRFDLGPKELAGLRRYHELATRLGLAPADVPIRLHRERALAAV
ncbi:MAG: hypothetical protein K2W96_01780, partial [Gemmataceae bacterium]|nr:hypothetical protein [Gemmataceae bacterium]